MKKILVLVAFAALTATPAFAGAQGVAPAPTPGKMLYATGGKRLAAVYRVATDGSLAIILDGKLVTVPASSLSVEGDKIVTSLTRKDLRTAK